MRETTGRPWYEIEPTHRIKSEESDHMTMVISQFGALLVLVGICLLVIGRLL